MVAYVGSDGKHYIKKIKKTNMLRVDSGFNETSRHHLSRSLRRGDGYFNISAAAGNPSRLLKTVTAIQIWVADKQVSTVKENLEESWNLQMSLS